MSTFKVLCAVWEAVANGCNYPIISKGSRSFDK
jgi:hypothetical protein